MFNYEKVMDALVECDSFLILDGYPGRLNEDWLVIVNNDRRDLYPNIRLTTMKSSWEIRPAEFSHQNVVLDREIAYELLTSLIEQATEKKYPKSSKTEINGLGPIPFEDFPFNENST